MPKRSPRQEYRLKQREHIEASPVLSVKFPQLKALKVTLEYFDPSGTNKHGEMKFTVNVEHAKSILCVACPGGECTGGDFDLSEAVAQAVAGRLKVLSGELHCQGTRRRGDHEPALCRTLLRYRLSLAYGRRRA